MDMTRWAEVQVSAQTRSQTSLKKVRSTFPRTHSDCLCPALTPRQADEENTSRTGPRPVCKQRSELPNLSETAQAQRDLPKIRSQTALELGGFGWYLVDWAGLIEFLGRSQDLPVRWPYDVSAQAMPTQVTPTTVGRSVSGVWSCNPLGRGSWFNAACPGHRLYPRQGLDARGTYRTSSTLNHGACQGQCTVMGPRMLLGTGIQARLRRLC